jgi:hypothetical protein
LAKLATKWSSLDVDALPYAAFFCEENVWQIARSALVPVPVSSRHVVFISNAQRAVAMWSQRAAVVDPVLWDYHVVLLADGVVVDVDCTAGKVLPVRDWVVASFREGIPDQAKPRFRVVDAAVFAALFSSDRSHMQGAGKPEPPWPAPWQPALGMNLMRFVDLDDDVAGFVCDLSGLLAFAERE